MSKYFKNYWSLAIVAGIIVLFDQITKYLVRTNLSYGEQWAPWGGIVPFVRIIHVQNTGAAFGMLPDLKDIFLILAIIVSGVIIYYYPQVPAEEWPIKLAMGLQCGGALGNLIDRVFIGHVTDFVAVGNFAVFNVADSSISVGTVVLIGWMWFQDRKQKQEQLIAPNGDSGLDDDPAQVSEEPASE